MSIGTRVLPERNTVRTNAGYCSQAAVESVPQHEHLRIPEASDNNTILKSVQDLASLLADSDAAGSGSETIARSSFMREIIAQARRVAASKASLLIEGESGTGKELIARIVHYASRRAQRPFVRVNCAAFSDGLVESELFGHEKGAFTGASETRIGRFELADGGTFLLDEISEMSLQLQAKLLRVLETEEFERVGGTKTLKVDVRIIATSNRNLDREVAEGNFRRDLFYRLNVVRVRLPALRERRDDIPPLVEHFCRLFGRESGIVNMTVSHKTMEILQAYEWPGNVRQLRNVVQRACILASSDVIQPSDLPPLDNPAPAAESLRGNKLEDIERIAILQALRDTGGNKAAAAERLGVTTRTLLNKMNKYRALGVA